MRKLYSAVIAELALGAPAQAATHKLMILSVDGLDWRYVRDRDALGLKIPNIRRLLAKSSTADGVTGVWPTITWPSHTTMITAPTLVQCLAQRGMTVGAVNWPVTVDAKINWNLPEAYAKRDGDSSDID